MRILHLLASPAWTGPAENIARLAVAQRALGHQVSVAVDRKREGLTSEERRTLESVLVEFRERAALLLKAAS